MDQGPSFREEVFVGGRACHDGEWPALWVCMSASVPHAILFHVTTDSVGVSQEARFVDCHQAVTNAWSLFCTLKNSLPENEEKTLALHAHARAVKDRKRAAKRKS